MTIRLAVLSPNRFSDGIFESLCKQSSGSVEIALNLGKKQADYRATSLSRMNARRAKSGHLLDGARRRGLEQALFEHSDYYRLRAEFTDHMGRSSYRAKVKSHALETIDDYHSYYHVLCEALATELIDRRVTHVVFLNVPHLGYDTALHHVARALGLPVLILTQSLFANRVFSMTDPADMGQVPGVPADAPRHAIKQDARLDLFYMKGIRQDRGTPGRISAAAIAELVFFLVQRRRLKALNPFYVGRLIKRMNRIYRGLPDWRDPFARFFHEDSLAYFEHLCEFEDQDVDLSGDFVYFPLQMQPEMTTSAIGGGYSDQAYAIERLAAILPDGVRILVKENPKQGAYMRGPLFFHRLQRIPAVQFLPSWANTHDLMANARFVATVTGTAGWEAICQGKPALVFGHAWYRDLPGVVKFDKDVTYDDVAQKSWDHAALESAVGGLLARTHTGVIDPAYRQIYPDFDADQNAKALATTLLDLLQGRITLTFGKTAAT